MPDRDALPRRERVPLVRSAALLRAIATAVTLTSLASMSAFAATHPQNTAAPLNRFRYLAQVSLSTRRAFPPAIFAMSASE